MTEVIFNKDLTPLREAAFAEIDAQAARIEEKIASKHPTHNVKYLEKAAEAREIVARDAAGDPIDPAEFPLLNSEVGITASTLLEVAQAVLTLREQWKAASAQLETVRLQAKKDVRDAANPAEINTATNVAWPFT